MSESGWGGPETGMPSTSGDLPPQEYRPQPIPLPVTSARGAASPGSHRRATVIVSIAVAAALVLASIAGEGLLLYSARGTISKTVQLSVGLVERVRLDYPGYTMTSTSSDVATDPGVAYVERRFFVRMRDPRVNGFSMRAVYTAPDGVTDSARFANSDGFFASTVETRQPVASFERMWVKEHPDTVVLFVDQLDTSTEATRTYEVGFVKATGLFQVMTVYVAHGAADDSWHPIGANEAWLGAESGDLPMIGSSVDTATIVERVFPGFEDYRSYRTSTGAWQNVIRRRGDPSVMLAVDIDMLPYYDDSDGEKQLLGSQSARAVAFMRAWSSRHPDSIITMISVDPDSDGSAQLIEVYYASFQKDSPFLGAERSARLRYKPSARRWAWVKTSG